MRQKVQELQDNVQRHYDDPFVGKVHRTLCEDVDDSINEPESGDGIHLFCFAGSFSEFLGSAEFDLEQANAKLAELEALIRGANWQERINVARDLLDQFQRGEISPGSDVKLEKLKDDFEDIYPATELAFLHFDEVDQFHEHFEEMMEEAHAKTDEMNNLIQRFDHLMEYKEVCHYAKDNFFKNNLKNIFN